MPGYEIPSLRFALSAGGTVTIRRFVKLDSNGNGIQATNGDAAVGVSTVNATVDQVLEVSDGIAIVEAGGAVTPNDVIQSDASGRAITRTSGIALGVAITSAAAAGELIAVKTPAVSAGANSLIFMYTQSDLAAGADVAATGIYVVPAGFKFTVKSIEIIPAAAAAGIDAGDTALIEIKSGANVIASKTYSDTVVFPAALSSDTLGAITNGNLVAGDVLAIVITQGATANLPVFSLQITGSLESV